MKRTVGVERSFKISDFNIVKPTEFLSDIPDKFALNDEFISKVRFIQLLGVELTFRKYLKLKTFVDAISLEDAIEFLEEQKAHTIDELKQIIEEED